MQQNNCQLDFLKELVQINGSFNIRNISELHSFFIEKKEILSEWKRIIVDLSGLENFDSSSIQILLSLHKSFPKRVEFSHIPPGLIRALELHGFSFRKNPSSF